MKRIWIVLLTMAMVLSIALPAAAKKPDRPDKPTGFKPMACEVDVPFATADVRNAEETIFGVLAPFTLIATEAGGFNETRYTVDPATEGDLSPGHDVLCVTVTLVEGTLRDLRVRWLDYDTNLEGGCELNWARGKELSRINNGEVFRVGLSLEGWSADYGGLCGAQNDSDGGKMTVAVMPVPKSDTATLTVEIGLDIP